MKTKIGEEMYFTLGLKKNPNIFNIFFFTFKIISVNKNSIKTSIFSLKRTNLETYF